MDFNTGRLCMDELTEQLDSLSCNSKVNKLETDESVSNEKFLLRKNSQKIKKWSALSLSKNKFNDPEDNCTAAPEPSTSKFVSPKGQLIKRKYVELNHKTPSKISPSYKKLKTIIKTNQHKTNNTTLTYPKGTSRTTTEDCNDTLTAFQISENKCMNNLNKENVCNIDIDLSDINWLEDTQTMLQNLPTSSKRLPKNVEEKITQKSNKIEELNADDFLLSFSDKSLCKATQKQLNTNDNITGLQDHFSDELFLSFSNSNLNVQELSLGHNQSQFSQFCNTQVLAQLDKVIQEEDEKYATTKTKSDFEVTSSTEDKINKSKSNEQDLYEKLWQNTNTVYTTQMLDESYRRDVDMVFEKLETTICELGPNNNNRTLNIDRKKSPNNKQLAKNKLLEKIVDIIKEPDKLDDSLKNVDLADDSDFANVLLNLTESENNFTLGNIIKKALSENAKKAAEPNELINCTVEDTQPEFKVLGDFFHLPNKVKDLMKLYKGIDTLYEWQKECLNLPAVAARKNLVYALPTSGGKTLVAEILMLREVLCRNRNVIFVLPYVSIVQEKIWALSPFAVALDFLIEEYAAGKGNFPPRKRRRKNSIYIATIEKALGLVNSLIESNRISELGLVVVDELHLIGDQSRGSALESLLTKLIFVKENIQIIGMSATIGNLGEICKFLEATLYTQNFRPVELVEYVKSSSAISKINWSAVTHDELLVPDRIVDFPYGESIAKIDPDRLGGLVLEVIPKESCLIFCSSKKNCENVAYLLCKIIFPKLKEHKKKEKADLLKALSEETSNICNILSVSIPFGVAYHHSGLTSEERKLIEDAFRNSIISVICCTSTLAAGVNLPAKRVILRQPYVGRDFINLSRYKQMVGRAGRTGFGESGESILICNEQELPRVKQMLMAPMDIAQSSMHEFEYKGLRHLILSCINLKLANTRGGLQKIIGHTLLSVQQTTLDVNIKKITDQVISELFKLGALQNPDMLNNDSGTTVSSISVQVNTSVSSPQSAKKDTKQKRRITINNDTKLCISKLGSAAIRAGLDLSKAHILYEDLCQAQSSLVLVDCLHLLYLVTPYDLSEQVNPSKSLYYTIFTQLSTNELQTARILGLTESCAMKLMTNQPIRSVSERVLNRFFVTLMLYDLWNEVSVYQVSEKYQVNRGQIQNLMTSAASFASNVVSFCEELTEFWAFADLLRGMSKRLSHCCVKELVPLMELPAVKQNRARQLFLAGYKTLQSIAKADPNELVQKIEFMSRKVANQLIAASKMLLLEKVENLREEAEDVLDGIEQPKVGN